MKNEGFWHVNRFVPSLRDGTRGRAVLRRFRSLRELHATVIHVARLRRWKPSSIKPRGAGLPSCMVACSRALARAWRRSTSRRLGFPFSWRGEGLRSGQQHLFFSVPLGTKKVSAVALDFHVDFHVDTVFKMCETSFLHAPVVELADTQDSGSCAARRRGSTPFGCTILV